VQYYLKSKKELEKELKNLRFQYNELQASYAIMQEREIQYRELLDSLKEVIFEIDMECKLRFCNQHAYEFFGYPDGDDYLGLEVMDYIVPEDRPRIMEAIKRLFQSSKTSANEYMAMRKDGQRFPIVIHTVPIFRNSQPFGLRGVIMDISQRKKIIFLSQFDTLTGLYNRYYFESEIEHYNNIALKEIGIVVCDVDGLKLINDTMGH